MNHDHNSLVSPRMVALFALSAFVMVVHKAECWVTVEWLVSPFYGWLVDLYRSYSDDPFNNVGQAAFTTFVTCLTVSVVAVTMLLSGRRGTWAFLALWGGMFFVEWHHIFRSVVAGEYYSGLYTAMVFVAIGPVYWRQLYLEVCGAVSAPLNQAVAR
jgi:hypothetical protein